MAITDVINQSWEGETHGEVERALKAALSQIMEMLEGIDPSGLTPEQVALLEKARTALQPSDVSQAGKTGSYNDLIDKPNYEGEVVMGYLNDGEFYELLNISSHGDPNYSDTAAAKDFKKLYVDVTTGAVYRWRGTGTDKAYEPFAINELSATSMKPVQSRKVYEVAQKLREDIKSKQDKITDVTEFIRAAVTELVGDGSGSSVLDKDGHIPYNLLPRLVLDGMNHGHSEVNINTQNDGKCFYCPGTTENPDKKIRYYYDNGAKWVTSDPDKGIIYCDRSEKKLYIWNATQSKMEALTAGEGGLTEDDVNGLIASAIDGYVQPGEDGRIPEALITNKDGKIPYSWMPSCFLDSINYVKGLKPTYELVGKVLFTTSGKILTVAATLVHNTSAYTWVEQDPSAGVLYWFENRPYRWNPSEGALEPYHICNIAIVGADEAVPSWADLCFFRASEDEGGGGGTVPDDPVTPDPDDPTPPEPQVITIEGDNFNALLAGNDHNTVYNPSQLYELDGVVDADNLDTNAPGYSYVSQGEREDEGEAVVTGNRVSYKYTDANDVEHTVLTPLNYYGDLVLSNTVKMADTADTAYLSFMVSGPFITPSTNIKVEFTDTDVEVYYWMKKNGNVLQQIPSGHVFQFSNTEAAREVMLVIKRKSLGMGSGYTTTALKTYVDITRMQSGVSHPSHVAVIFNPTRLYYRNDGAGKASGFSVASANAIELPEPFAPDGKAMLSYNKDKDTGLNCLLVDTSGKFGSLVSGVIFDMSKFNVFYVVLCTVDASWNEALVYDPSWSGAWKMENGVMVPRHQGIVSGDDCRYNAYQHSGALPDTALNKEDALTWVNERTGSYVMRCLVHNERDISNMQKTLDLYVAKVNNPMKILEFGIITYDTSLL